MIRLKYYSLTKEEKNKIKEEFYKTDYGKSIKQRLDRVFIIGILGIVYSIYLFIFPSNIWDTISGIILTIASLIFIIGSFKVRINKINNFLTKKKK